MKFRYRKPTAVSVSREEITIINVKNNNIVFPFVLICSQLSTTSELQTVPVQPSSALSSLGGLVCAACGEADFTNDRAGMALLDIHRTTCSKRDPVGQSPIQCSEQNE